MDRRAFAVSSLLAVPALTTALTQDKAPARLQTSHDEWVLAALSQMKTVKVGNARADLLKAFAAQGGIQLRARGSFYSRVCQFFRVDVEFDVQSSSDRDLITRISRPYLQRTIVID